MSESRSRRAGARAQLLLAGMLLVALGGCATYIRQRIYLPAPMPATTSWTGAAPQEVAATTADGLTLRGYYWPPRSGEEELIVFFHGQSGNRYTGAQLAAPFASEGAGVLVASYRGYGDNPGQPSERGLVADGAAFVTLARKLAPGSRIYLVGYSLGGAVALHTAAREDVAGVVTIGTFASLGHVAPAIARGVIPDRFDNLRAIAEVSEPILILHGSDDTVVPFAQARALRDVAPARTRLLTLEGASHGIDFEQLARVIRENLRQMPR